MEDLKINCSRCDNSNFVIDYAQMQKVGSQHFIYKNCPQCNFVECSTCLDTCYNNIYTVNKCVKIPCVSCICQTCEGTKTIGNSKIGYGRVCPTCYSNK
jgi:hypothetical protein